jgi:two-component system cell cycle response regulator
MMSAPHPAICSNDSDMDGDGNQADAGGRGMDHPTHRTDEYLPPSEAGEACLVVMHAPQRQLLGARAVLARAPVVLGRDPSCDLVLEVDNVSRRHARVREDGERHLLEDLGSTNGTFVGGERVETCVLEAGDFVRLGSVLIKYLTGGAVEALYHAEMKRLADEDALTGLAHKAVFAEALAREVARSRRHGHALSVALLDLDRFKAVNDSFGHLAGDELLRELAAALRPLVRMEQLLARFGGDELALLLPDVPPESAAIFGEKIRRLVEERVFEFEGVRIPVTVSIGIAALQPGDLKPEALFARADAHLYEAKAAGGNRVRS